MFGGIGEGGRKRLTGWHFKELTFLWHSLGRKLFGKKCLQYVFLKIFLDSFLLSFSSVTDLVEYSSNFMELIN